MTSSPDPVLIDLTHQVTTGMPVYPGDPEVALRPALTTDTAGVNVLSVHLGSQSGTHVDAPYHVDVTWPTLDGLPLSRFTGPAVVADLRALPARTPVTPDQLAPALERLTPGAILLLATGWPRFWGTERYLAHPYLTPEAAEAIVAAGVRTLGVDALSVDATPTPARRTRRWPCCWRAWPTSTTPPRWPRRRCWPPTGSCSAPRAAA